MNKVNLDPKALRIGTGVVGTVALMGLFFTANANVPANNVGIVYNGFNGGVQNKVLTNGFHWKMPFVDQLYLISTEIQETNLSKVTAQVKTGHYVDVDANIKWRVDESKAMEIFKNYRTLDRVKKDVILHIAQRAVEEVTTRYTLDEIMGSKRAEINAEIEKALTTALAKENIEFRSFVAVDIDAGEAYENALRNEAVKAKEADAAKHEIEKAKAQGEAEVAKVKAQTAKFEEEAKQKQILAEAEAKANQTISASLTENLLKLKEQEARLKHGWVEVITSGNVNTTR